METRYGIGVTSTPDRSNYLNFWWEQLRKHTEESSNILVCTNVDTDKKGIAYAKNRCLYVLRDCDFIFIFDNDTFIKSNGWMDFFIKSGVQHCQYMNNRYRPYQSENDATFYRDSAGCFMYLTKEAIEKVGYFNTEFKGYGMEHAAYSQRIHRASLTPAPYISLNRTSDYIHSLDLDGPFPGFDVEHKPSLSLAEMTEHIEHNRKVFEAECTDSPIYQPLEP